MARNSDIAYDETVTDEGTTEPEQFHVVDAYTGDVYGGIISPELDNEYNSGNKRITPTPRQTHVNGITPVLCRSVSRKDDATGLYTTTWYPVDVTNLPADLAGRIPGSMPGEWKFVHLLTGV